MFGAKKSRKLRFEDLMAQLRPDFSHESLGLGPDFPGVTPNPLLSGEARRRP